MRKSEYFFAKTAFPLLLFIIVFLPAHAQLKRNAIINEILIYGDYNYGMPLADSSATVVVNVVTESHTDSMVVEFNAVGQITRHLTDKHESLYTYGKDKITRRIKSMHPWYSFEECEDYQIDYYFLEGKVKYAEVICGQKKYRRDYHYSVADQNVVSVRIRSKDKGLEQEVFLFDPNGNFQWQSISNFGIRFNYSCHYQHREYVSNLGYDCTIMYGTIANETIVGTKRVVKKDKYTIFDLRGKRYGEIFVSRLPL
jgi:hypothetical protein